MDIIRVQQGRRGGCLAVSQSSADVFHKDFHGLGLRRNHCRGAHQRQNKKRRDDPSWMIKRFV
ncbi:MAG: hypothetical protein IH914_08155 [candidate division Zixibacteria bacterium]|nr:hypothetical protein [candidate division Zixibacteria bacterium]